MMRRSWIRVWIKESLRGSIRFDLTPAERSVWYELLLMAGESRRPGIIQAGDHQPLPIETIATWLSVPVEIVQSTINKCQKEGRIKIKDGFITIVNWKKYQGDYDGKISSEDKEIIPDFIRQEVWDAFKEMRKKKRAVLTEHAKELIFKKLEEYKSKGQDPNAILSRSVMNGWTGIFPLNDKQMKGREMPSDEQRKKEFEQ